MSSSPWTLLPPPGFQRYDCVGCGACCRGRFAIGVTPEEYARIMAQGWEADPALAGKTLFLPHGDHYVTAYDAAGACVFLDERGLCRIHAKFGEAAKPLACRLYPFRFIPAGRQARVSIRFDCPEVACNRGRALPAHLPALRALLPHALPPAAMDVPVPPLFGRVSCTWDRLARIIDAVDRLLCAKSLDVTRRVAGGVNFAALLRNPRLSALNERAFADFLTTVAGKVTEAAEGDALGRTAPPALARAAFRQLAGVYARADYRGAPARLGQRFATAVRLLTGGGAVPAIQPDFPAVPFSALEDAFGIPDAEAAEPIIRYLRARVLSMGFCGAAFYGRAVLDGLDALLFTYPLLLWFARLFSAGRNRSTLDRAAAERAVEIVDHQHGVTPILNLPSERRRLSFLCERTILRSLVVWYGS
ncbi:MAG TPA: YkgJ family cysteine cluster protein [Armatimonadota bacterium]|nr:YkgJ family cysteine cluster protein [Armatimonadota bacterium]